MPVVTVRAPRQISPAILAEVIVTTTIYPNGTAPPITRSTGTPDNTEDVPKGAIIGGILTGVVLAVIAVIVWKLWGRSIKKTEKKQKIEAEKARTTRANTRRNAGERTNPLTMYRPTFGQKTERKVQFVQQVSAKMSDVKNMTLSSILPTPPPPVAQTEFGEKPSSKPKPVRPLKTSLDMETEGLLEADSASSSPTNRPSPTSKSKGIRSKATSSSLSSGSMYSTQSQDGNDRPPSWAAAAWNRYSFLSKTSKTSMRGEGEGRLSQVSQESFSTASSQRRDSNGVPIGVAY